MSSLLRFIDRLTERGVRQVAHRHGRRSLLTRLGVLIAGGPLLPMLPFDRSRQAGAAFAAGRHSDPSQCDYWRYCAVDGFLCSCCGGSATTCPPGTTISKVSWIGTCHNPADGKDYLVSYNDCCGKTSCGRCFCNTNHGDRPGYRMGAHNDVNWCMADDSAVYHCTVSVIVGVPEKS